MTGRQVVGGIEDLGLGFKARDRLPRIHPRKLHAAEQAVLPQGMQIGERRQQIVRRFRTDDVFEGLGGSPIGEPAAEAVAGGAPL